jgi:hypothetical protein
MTVAMEERRSDDGLAIVSVKKTLPIIENSDKTFQSHPSSREKEWIRT